MQCGCKNGIALLYRMMSCYSTLCLVLVSCTSNSDLAQPLTPSSWQTINGRDEGTPLERFPLYRAKIPATWIRKDPSHSESILDTTKPLCELFIAEGKDSIRMTIHHFPIREFQNKIAPISQVNRWKSQFDYLELTKTITTPETRGGFTGLFLEGQGLFHGVPMKILAWSMQLAPEYDRQLILDSSFYARQLRADYTIKVLGPPALVDKYKADIMTFAYSFELIQALPSPL